MISKKACLRKIMDRGKDCYEIQIKDKYGKVALSILFRELEMDSSMFMDAEYLVNNEGWAQK